MKQKPLKYQKMLMSKPFCVCVCVAGVKQICVDVENHFTIYFPCQAETHSSGESAYNTAFWVMPICKIMFIKSVLHS